MKFRRPPGFTPIGHLLVTEHAGRIYAGIDDGASNPSVEVSIDEADLLADWFQTAATRARVRARPRRRVRGGTPGEGLHRA